ncbi:MAG: ATP-binding cassette domain-containing protein [Chloroflexota bacterium]|nr:MAG: ATP-binding cassette domain-containing protein [Chloroflexota bacterium]
MATQQSRIAASPLDLMSDKDGILLEAQHLNLPGKKQGNLLQEVSIIARPGEVISLVSSIPESRLALLQILAGLRRPASGQVMVAGAELYKNRKAFRISIGYVPGEDIVHRDLTVVEALRYSASLRLPKGTPDTVRQKRIQDVITDLELSDVQNRRLSSLDAELCKLTNLGVELITLPGLVFMEEPAAGLNPGAENRLMKILHKIADQGRAIILTAQSISSVKFADKLAVILPQGQLCWFGPPGEALGFFNSHSAAQNENGKVTATAEIFETIDKVSQSQAQEWVERFHSSKAYSQYLTSAAEKDSMSEPLLDERPLARRRKENLNTGPAPLTATKFSNVRQFFALVSRSIKLLLRDPLSLALLIGLPLLASIADILFFERTMYDPLLGDSTLVTSSLAMLIFVTMFVAGVGWIRDIRKEAGSFKRERQVSLKLIPYLLSKFFLIGLFVPYQAFVLSTVHYLTVSAPGGLAGLGLFFATLILVAWCGALLGILSAALTRSNSAAALLLVLFLVPQLVFSGAIMPVPKMNFLGTVLASLSPSRFAFDSLVVASGHAKDLANDICLRQPPDQRQALTESQKQVCSCIGKNIFTRCSFPGIQRFFVSTLQLPEPVVPEYGSNAARWPAQPPYEPGMTVEQYIEEVNAYTLDIEAHRQNLNSYIANLRTYMEELAAWEIMQNLAIGRAESQIVSEYDRFWPSITANITGRWLALLVTIFILIVIFAIVQKRKDAVV